MTAIFFTGGRQISVGECIPIKPKAGEVMKVLLEISRFGI